jgi:RNA polymerase sigma-70 factor (ECF subfamily)
MTVIEATGTARLVAKARDPALPLDEQHEAFALLVEGSQHAVVGLALSRLHDVEDAKDAAQESFAIAWRRLRQLRDPAAFASWIKSIVASECSRRRRQRTFLSEADAPPASVDADAHRIDYQSIIATALDTLPKGEQQVTVLFYYLGYTQPQIASLLRLKSGTVGKRLHSARLRIRRGLPRSVRADFVRVTPSGAFAERVRRGLLDEYIGEYRFDRRPDQSVSIFRDGDTLVGEAGGQRNVLLSLAEHSLATSHYDGEGRFRRNRRGEVTHFIYYEFGKRLGIARRITTPNSQGAVPG